MSAFEVIEAQLQLDTGGFSEGVGEAVDSLGGLGSAMENVDMRTAALGGALTALAAGGLAASIKAASSFQDEMVELEKVTDPETAAAMSEEIKNMAETIPLAQEELAQIASDAGRFGVRGEENIQSFTEAVSKMSVATDLSATEAGESLAKLAELTGTPISEVENLGSSINELSNNMATSSSEIVDSMLRSSSAMSQFGLSQTEIAGFSGALNAVSESSERAGSRLRRLMQEMSNPKKIDNIAGALGMTVEEFKAMQQNDPAGLIRMMAAAMGEGGTEAENLNKVLSTTSRQALSGLGQNLDGLDQALEMSANSFEENTSLQKEFDAASRTLSNQVQLLKNRLTNVGISIGTVLLPPLTTAVKVVADAVSVFSKFNSALGGLPGAIALIGTLVTGVAMLIGSFAAVISTSAVASAALGGALAGLGTAVSVLISPVTAVLGVLTSLPSIAIGAATALNSALYGALASITSALLGLPALIYSTAVSFGTTLVTGVMGAVSSLLAFPGAVASAVAAKITATLQAGILATAYGGLRTAAFVAAGGVRTLGTALLSTAAPILALTAIAIALYAAWKSNFLGIRDITQGVVTGIKALLAGDFQTVKDLIGQVATRARQLWTNNIVPILTRAREVFTQLRTQVIQPFLEWFTPIFQSHLSTIASEFVKTANVWIATISRFVEWVRPYINVALQQLTAWWGQHGSDVMAIVNPLMSFLKRVITDGLSLVSDIVVGLLRLMRGDFSGFAESVTSIVDTLTQAVVDLFRWLYDILVGNSVIPEMLSDIKSAFSSFFSDLLGSIGDFAGDVVQDFRDLASDAVSALLDKVSSFRSAGKSLVLAVGEGIRRNVSKVKGKVEGAAQKIRDYWPSSPAKEGPLSDIDEIGPGLMREIAQGITSNQGLVIGAAQSAAQGTRRTLSDIVDDHGEFDSGAAMEALGTLGTSQRLDLASALEDTKWFEKSYEASRQIRDAVENQNLSQQLYDGLISQSGAYDKLEQLVNEGDRDENLVRAEDGSMVPASFYDNAPSAAQNNTSSGGSSDPIVFDFRGVDADAMISFGGLEDLITEVVEDREHVIVKSASDGDFTF